MDPLLIVIAILALLWLGGMSTGVAGTMVHILLAIILVLAVLVIIRRVKSRV
jgi:hypothetical protein